MTRFNVIFFRELVEISRNVTSCGHLYKMNLIDSGQGWQELEFKP